MDIGNNVVECPSTKCIVFIKDLLSENGEITNICVVDNEYMARVYIDKYGNYGEPLEIVKDGVVTGVVQYDYIEVTYFNFNNCDYRECE